MSNKIVLSICIPSYNRGHRAFELVESIMPLLEQYKEIEVVVSDNGSEKNTEGYKKIEDICHDRIKFNRFKENQYFWGNINQVLKMASGDFALLISDEDKIVNEAVPSYIELCRNHKDVSVIRSNSDLTYWKIEDNYAKKGIDAIKNFYMLNNYISGVIYNRNIVNDDILDMLYNEFKNNISYRFYPHEVIDAYCVVSGDFLSSGIRLIEEGVEEKEQDEIPVSQETSDLRDYNTYASRLQQQHGFVQVIKDLWCAGEGEKAQMFLRLISKTRFLYDITRDIVKTNDEDFKNELLMLRDASMDDLKYLNLAVINNNIDMWIEFIDETMK